MTEPVIPESLIEHLRASRCVAWCGAGVSMMSGMPSWRELIEHMIVACAQKGLGKTEVDELSDMLHEKLYDDVADYCRDFLKELGYEQCLNNVFHKTQKPSALHQQLMRLPFSAIVTTNYDKIIENVYTQIKEESTVVLTNRKEEVSRLWPRLVRNEHFILKAHGHIDQPDTIVLSGRDYTKLVFGNFAFMQFLQMLFMSKSILFVGTSLSDVYIRRTLEETLYLSGGFGMPHFAICPRLGPIRSNLWLKRFNISVIHYDSDSDDPASYQAVVNVLDKIYNRLQK